MTEPSKIIAIENLSYAYPDGRAALKDISLSLARGEKVAIAGANGAGKSTLLLNLNGILIGTGRVHIDGIELSKSSLREIRRRVGLVMQDPNDQLFCPTVRDDVMFGPIHLGARKEELAEIVSSSLELVGLKHAADRASHHLSIGERRRAAIAAVLACKPVILAMDEPQAMLDPKRRRWLLDFINATDLTTLIATHDLEFARHSCKRTIVMNSGRIVYDGATEELLKDEEFLAKNELA